MVGRGEPREEEEEMVQPQPQAQRRIALLMRGWKKVFKSWKMMMSITSRFAELELLSIVIGLTVEM